jgi:hypothetical protein
MSNPRKSAGQFVICVRNDGYPASLERRKIYQMIPDAAAKRHAQNRIIDESGEDYLYPAAFFVPVDLPAATRRAVLEMA